MDDFTVPGKLGKNEKKKRVKINAAHTYFIDDPLKISSQNAFFTFVQRIGDRYCKSILGVDTS